MTTDNDKVWTVDLSWSSCPDFEREVVEYGQHIPLDDLPEWVHENTCSDTWKVVEL